MTIPRAEISYDLSMEADMSFVEGTFRLPGQDWHVFIFSRRSALQPRFRFTEWDSGVSGIHVEFPESLKLDQAAVERILSTALDVEQWSVVRGPDSMELR
jgi:hypothetical protein